MGFMLLRGTSGGFADVMVGDRREITGLNLRAGCSSFRNQVADLKWARDSKRSQKGPWS